MIPAFLKSVNRILVLGAHSDDIEIGAGGTLLTAIAANPELEIYWAVFSAPEVRAAEAYASASEYLSSLTVASHWQVANPKDSRIRIESFPVSYFPDEWTNIKLIFEDIKSSFEPDVVFTHYRDDRHQDHRVLSDLAWNTFRNHLILEYEIPKYDGDLGSPNLFVPLSGRITPLKVKLLMKHFQTQHSKHWFSGDTFKALMRLRGMECASETGYAEAFYCRKLVLGY